ncbi:MAG: hypothetical protein LBJ10_10895, partial [Clostridiales bacterium]|nr:hypothetical protein [Clostridiales bacterium]
MKARFQYPDMPALPPRPAFCAGIQAPVRKLSGSWRARAAEEAEFYAATAESANRAFETVTVPIDMATRCKDTPAYRERYVLQTEIALPEDMRGKNLWLYFEAVNGAAKVYVDGQPAAEHIGGFVAWAADITAHAAGKERVRLAVAVDETAERVSSFSHGGIIRDVWLYAFPDAYFTGLRARTRFDMRFCDAVLELRACIAGHADGARVHVGLRDQFGAQAAECSVAAEDASCFELAVPAPRKWDAEHPSLYMAEVSLVAPDGRILETICQQIGFRQIQRAGNLLLVNGKPVKLRGVCRHEVT